MAFRTPAGTWRVIVRVKGRRICRNFRTKVRADAWAQRVKAGGDPEPRPQTRVPTLDEFFDSWERSYAQVELADSTAAGASFLAKKHLLPKLGRFPLDAIDRDACLEFRAALNKTLAPSYANNVLNLARRLFKVAAQTKVIAENPWDGVRRLKVPEQAFSFWTLAERDRALAWLAEHDPAFGELVTVAVHTGLRWGELYALERRHIDLDQARLTVTANYRPGPKTRVEQTKTGKIGFVPLNDAALSVLSQRANHDPSQTAFDPKLLRVARYRLLAVAKGAGVKPIRFHDLRHTFASNLRMTGVSLETVRDLMRHTSITMTLRYAHLGADDLALAAAKLCDKPVTEPAPKGPLARVGRPVLTVISGK
jgi:integrase